MNSRRSFIKKTALGATAASLLPLSTHATISIPYSAPNISLAQWSLHRTLEKGLVQAVDFAQIAQNTYGINAVEYVNQFYVNMVHSEKFWSQMKQNAENEGVKAY